MVAGECRWWQVSAGGCRGIQLLYITYIEGYNIVRKDHNRFGGAMWICDIYR